jgi:trehalose/maltose hydrolase-like predicted phosphorylase
MHALAAARLGYTAMALDYFRQSAAINLSDTHVAVNGGIHIGALGRQTQSKAVKAILFASGGKVS